MTTTDRMDSQELESKYRALEMARRTLAVQKEQSAGYTALTIPAHLVIELQKQQRKVWHLKKEIASFEAQLGSTPKPIGLDEKLAQPSRRLSLSETVAGYQRDLKEARASGHRLLEGKLLSQLGAVYSEAGQLTRAIEHYEQALTIARELGDRQAKATRLQNLGLALLRLANAEPDRSEAHLSRAADALRRAMDLFDMLEADPLIRARTRYHLGRCHHQLGRWREAITLLEQVRKTFTRHKARPELAHALLELGQLYHLIQDFESAYIYFKDALRLFRRIEDTDGIAVTQEALGNLALQTARLPEAIMSLQEARQGYAALRRSERVRAVDDLLHIARQSHQPVGGTIL